MARALSSTPYRWPWHGAFEPKCCALVVVHDGLKHLPEGRTWESLERLMRLARDSGMTLVDLPPARGLGAGSIAPRMFDVVLSRPHIGGFYGTDLDAQLRIRKLTDLVICGFPFEIGADTTMREANDLGYECLALRDCCTGVTEETLAGALHSIEMSGGIFGAVAPVAAFEELLMQLAVAGGPEVAKDVA